MQKLSKILLLICLFGFCGCTDVKKDLVITTEEIHQHLVNIEKQADEAISVTPQEAPGRLQIKNIKTEVVQCIKKVKKAKVALHSVQNKPTSFQDWLSDIGDIILISLVLTIFIALILLYLWLKAKWQGYKFAKNSAIMLKKAISTDNSMTTREVIAASRQNKTFNRQFK